MKNKEIVERVRARFLRDVSGERVDGYLLRDNADGTVSIATVENVEEFVLAEIRLAREDSVEVADAWAMDTGHCKDAERWLAAGGIGNVVAGIAAAIAAAIRERGTGE